VGAATVFFDDFSSGNFSKWTLTSRTDGASQSVNNVIAHFSVPAPSTAGECTYSYLRKDGFTSTPSSLIVASQDIYL
jgi:hypothetical protein